MSTTKALTREYAQAKAELDRIARRDRRESDDFVAANDRVAKLAEQLPWWRRW